MAEEYKREIEIAKEAEYYYKEALMKIDDLDPFIQLTQRLETMAKNGEVNNMRRALVVFCVKREENLTK